VLQTSLDDFMYPMKSTPTLKNLINKRSFIYTQNIQDICNERGIEIMSPHYRAARDGNNSTIPATYLDKEYKAPSFNVNFKSTPQDKQ
jgi:hypothetical protein